METLLFYITLLMFAGFSLNCIRLAFAHSHFWGMLSVLFPPSWLAFYPVHWRDIRIQGIAHCVSFIGLLLFSSLYIRANPLEFDNHALASLRDVVAPAFAATPLALSAPKYATDLEVEKSRQLHSSQAYSHYAGVAYQFQQATFSDQMLRFKQLQPVKEPIEFVIDLSGFYAPTNTGLALHITPDSLHRPLVHVLKYAKGSAIPQVDSFDHGYWLELMLSNDGDAFYEGQIQLKLPDGKKSFLAGNFGASAQDLIWEFGEVNPQYDSNDTIQYVAQQYLLNHLGSSLQQVQSFSRTFFQTNLEEPTAHTLAKLSMVDGSEHDIQLRLFKSDQGWVVEHTPVRELISALQVIEEEAPAAIIPVPIQPSVYSIDQVDELIGRSVRIITQDGRTREGIVDAVDRYNVSLVVPFQAGEVAMLVKRREVKEIVVRD